MEERYAGYGRTHEIASPARGRGPAAGQPGNALAGGQDGLLSRPSTVTPAPSLSKEAPRTMTKHDISGGLHDKT